MLTSRGVRKRYVVDLYRETLDKETASFPTEFESVSDETHKIIGLDERESQKVKEFEKEMNSYKEKSKGFAENIFANLFGDKTLNYSLPEIKELESQRPKIKTPDEEEEIFYTPSEDEILPEDEEEDIVDHEPVRTRFDLMDQKGHRDKGPRSSEGQSQRHAPRDGRGPGQDHRDQRSRPHQNSGRHNRNRGRPQK